MVRTEFIAFLRELGAYYQHKVEPTERTEDLWFDRVEKIPSEPLAWIKRRIQDDCDRWPSNICRSLWLLYREWLESHPEKRANKVTIGCDECDDGVIYVEKASQDGTRYRYSFRCGKCGSSDMNGFPMARLRDLIQAGYERAKVDIELEKACGKSKHSTVQQMIDGIGR